MEQNTKNPHNTIPSVEAKQSLNDLSVSFKPTDVKFLLSLKSKSSLEECANTANGMIKRLKMFIENDYSTEGLDLKYTSVKTY